MSTWTEMGSTYILGDTADQVNNLPPALYMVMMHPKFGLVLEKAAEKFEVPSKIYALDNGLINRVQKTWDTTNRNLGLLLTGVKGTGKTVTGKIVANNSKLPVIMIAHKFDHLPEFINSIQQPVVVFFDEYEKIYTDYRADILSVMDGMLDNGFRRLFILTTNEQYVNHNMLQRPGRIRYLKHYGDLTSVEVDEIVSDLLVHKHHAEALKAFIPVLETITIDIVRAIIEEINIHDEPPEAFKDVFNVKKIDNVFDVSLLTIEDGKPKTTLLMAAAQINPAKDWDKQIGETFYANRKDIGDIKSVTSDGVLTLETEELNSDNEWISVTKNYVLESRQGKHKSYMVF